jgi:hypothetical protein
MKVYKLLHKPTGLYFVPSKGNGNFSTKGKIYPTKPSISWTEKCRIVFYKKNKQTKKEEILINHFNIKKDSSSWHVDIYVKTKPEEWEIETIE